MTRKLLVVAAIVICVLCLDSCDDPFGTGQQINNVVISAADYGYDCAKEGKTKEQMHAELAEHHIK